MSNNIVTATFNERNLAVTTALYAHDYGQILQFDGVELPEYFEVHFANEGDSTTTSQLGQNDRVDIPNALLETGKKVVAYLYLHNTVADGETVYKVVIPVRQRPSSPSVNPTPEQQDVITEAIVALNNATSHAPEIVDGYWYVWDADEDEYVNTEVKAEGTSGVYVGTDTPTDPDVNVWVDPSGDGVFCPVPAGGTNSQVLGKLSDDDYDVGWVDQSGGWGGGTSDYSALSNKPSIEGVTLTGNKTASDLGLAKASDISSKQAKITASGILKGDGNGGVSAATAGTDYGTYSKPSGGIPASDMASAVQTSLGKADTALQSYTETDPTVPSWAKAAQKPSYTASEVGAIAAPANPSSGQFLVYDGSAWVAQTLATWSASSY